MTVPVERWTAGGTRYLVVDASDHVRDRRAFAAAHCRTGDGEGEAGAADGGHAPPDGREGDGEEAGATDGGHVPADNRGDGTAAPDANRPAAAGVLFLAPDPEPTPPRVVTTLVEPTGRRPVRPAAARVAAAWTAGRTGAGTVMVDAPRGTLPADVGGAEARAEAEADAGRTVTVPDPRTGATASGVVSQADDGAVPRVPPRQVE